MVQDAIYLVEYARAMLWVAAQMNDAPDIIHMLDAAKETFQTESLLKEKYFKEFNIATDTLQTTEPAPSCKAHIDHLFRYTRSATLTEGLCAILPCSWIYVEIGLKYTAGTEIPDTNPYKSWLQTYADPAFADLVEWWFERLDSESRNLSTEERNHVSKIFRDSCRFEWLFWEMSWKQEQWPDK
jgi:thiaminase/transcriptional activator TenA